MEEPAEEEQGTVAMEHSDDEEPAEEEKGEPSEKEADEPHADAL